MTQFDFKKFETNDTQEYMAFGVDEMHELGFQLAQYFPLPAVVYLSGDLGAGKTTLIQGLTKFYKYSSIVSSPTYNLIHEYPTELANIAHLDLYRINDPEEVDMLGLVDLLTEESLILIEWPEKGGERIPEAQFSIEISIVNDAEVLGRRVVVSRVN